MPNNLQVPYSSFWIFHSACQIIIIMIIILSLCATTSKWFKWISVAVRTEKPHPISDYHCHYCQYWPHCYYYYLSLYFIYTIHILHSFVSMRACACVTINWSAAHYSRMIITMIIEEVENSMPKLYILKDNHYLYYYYCICIGPGVFHYDICRRKWHSVCTS